MRKLRYAAVIFCGAAVVAAASFTSCGRAAETDTGSKSVRAEGRKSAGGIARGDDDSGDDDPERSTRETVADSVPEVKETSKSAETETEEHTEAATAAEAEETLTGLRAYFEHKLIVNMDKAAISLNIRREPNEDSEVLDLLCSDDAVTYIGKTGNWYEIEKDGYTGYVNASYVYTDGEAYEVMRHSVAYAAMVQTYESYLYALPDTSTEVILCAHKSDSFRIRSVTEDYYEVQVSSELYDTLYMPKEDAIVYYLFLGQGNSNELTEDQEEYFSSLVVEGNMGRTRELIAEYAEALAEYQEYLSSSEAASLEAEQAYLAASMSIEEAYRAAQAAAEAAEIASREAEQAYLASSWQAEQEAASVKTQTPADESGGAKYLGNFFITHYCHCPICCGVWGSNDPNYNAHGSTGMKLQENYSVAVNPAQIPYGSRILINGQEYIAADLTDAPNNVDIYMRTHDAALAAGAYYADVYLLP